MKLRKRYHYIFKFLYFISIWIYKRFLICIYKRLKILFQIFNIYSIKKMLYFKKGKNNIHNNIRDFINPIFLYAKLDNLRKCQFIN